MGKCKECAWFPWKLGTSLSGLPATRCHPEQSARRFTDEGIKLETSCQYFKLNEEINKDTKEVLEKTKELKKKTSNESKQPDTPDKKEPKADEAEPEGEGDENEPDTGTDNKAKKASK